MYSDLYVGLSVHVSQDLFQAPEAALENAEDDLGHPSSSVLQLLLEVGQNDTNHLYYGNDESSEGKGTRVKAGGRKRGREGRIEEGRKRGGGGYTVRVKEKLTD